MATGKKPEPKKESSSEQVSADESLKRMKTFPKRKENLIAAVKKSKN